MTTMRLLTALTHALLVGGVVFALVNILHDGAEELANRVIARCRKKRIGLMTVSNAIKKP